MIEHVIELFRNNADTQQINQKIARLARVSSEDIEQYLDIELSRLAVTAKKAADAYTSEYNRQLRMGMNPTGHYYPYIRFRASNNGSSTPRLQCEWRSIVFTSRARKETYTRYLKKGSTRNRYPLSEFRKASDWEKEIISFTEDYLADVRSKAVHINKVRRNFKALNKALEK